MTRPLRRFVAALSVLGLMAAGCGSAQPVEEAAAAFRAPAEYVISETETLDGLDATTRRFVFNTELSQRDACDAARTALEAWAEQQIPETLRPESRMICSFEIHSPKNHPDIDFAAARVARLEVDEQFVADMTAPGGVEQVRVFFTNDK